MEVSQHNSTTVARMRKLQNLTCHGKVLLRMSALMRVLNSGSAALMM